jgi:flavin reductase (DIM6/NTAB) family NADH-FMN oxidoreductase RutF
MDKLLEDKFKSLNIDYPIWDQVFTVAPLVVIGTKEGKNYNLAPKHMATPMGLGNYFGFVCTPRHHTYHNIKKHKYFTVSFPLPDQVTLTSLSASSRDRDFSESKRIIEALPTIKAETVDALLLTNSYLYLECELFKIIDGFDQNSIITGKIIKAYAEKDYIRISELDEQEQIKNNPLLAYIANGRFATISQTFNFPFPKDFKR